MHPLEQARMIAMNTPPGTPLFVLAEAVCRLRMVHPNGMNMGAGMLNWQAVVMEQALLTLMSRAMPV